MDASAVFNLVGTASYYILGAVALWGAYFVVLVMTRVNRKRFKTEDAQDAFVDSIEDDLKRGDFDAVLKTCEGEARALPMMVTFACKNKVFGHHRRP